MDKSRKKTKQYLVCYLDILGGTKLIQNDIENKYLNEISELYETAIQQCRVRHIYHKERKVKIFSDNIVIAQEYADDMKFVQSFLQLIHLLQWLFLGRKILLRGGITLGDLFIDDTFVWGAALLAAYNIESSIALYPRVIIDDSLLKRLPRECISQLYTYSDALPFVDYFQLKGDDGGRFPHLLKQYRKTLLELWHDTKGCKNQQKILWLISYFNQKCIDDARLSFVIPINPYQCDQPIDIKAEIDNPIISEINKNDLSAVRISAGVDCGLVQNSKNIVINKR